MLILANCLIFGQAECISTPLDVTVIQVFPIGDNYCQF